MTSRQVEVAILAFVKEKSPYFKSVIGYMEGKHAVPERLVRDSLWRLLGDKLIYTDSDRRLQVAGK